MDLIRDTAVGQLLRIVTRNRVLKYPEELPGFQCPLSYKGTDGQEAASEKNSAVDAEIKPSASDTTKDTPASAGKEDAGGNESTADSTREPDVAGAPDEDEAEDSDDVPPPPVERRRSVARVDMANALQKSITRTELEQRFAEACRLETGSDDESITPEKLGCGTIVVDWYHTGDSANPQNWSLRRKMFVSAIL